MYFLCKFYVFFIVDNLVYNSVDIVDKIAKPTQTHDKGVFRRSMLKWGNIITERQNGSVKRSMSV